MTFPDSRLCDRCGGALIFNGRISLPPQTIYKCASCGHQKWNVEDSPPYQARAQTPDQPQVQQQQQQQPKSEAQHDADENDDASGLQSGLRGGPKDK
jgi:DNA-directed RNA polymerase subunit M/transcription elongation factor TFIIS